MKLRRTVNVQQQDVVRMTAELVNPFSFIGLVNRSTLRLPTRPVPKNPLRYTTKKVKRLRRQRSSSSTQQSVTTEDDAASGPLPSPSLYRSMSLPLALSKPELVTISDDSDCDRSQSLYSPISASEDESWSSSPLSPRELSFTEDDVLSDDFTPSSPAYSPFASPMPSPQREVITISDDSNGSLFYCPHDIIDAVSLPSTTSPLPPRQSYSVSENSEASTSSPPLLSPPQRLAMTIADILAAARLSSLRSRSGLAGGTTQTRSSTPFDSSTFSFASFLGLTPQQKRKADDDEGGDACYDADCESDDDEIGSVSLSSSRLSASPSRKRVRLSCRDKVYYYCKDDHYDSNYSSDGNNDKYIASHPNDGNQSNDDDDGSEEEEIDVTSLPPKRPPTPPLGKRVPGEGKINDDLFGIFDETPCEQLGDLAIQLQERLITRLEAKKMARSIFKEAKRTHEGWKRRGVDCSPRKLIATCRDEPDLKWMFKIKFTANDDKENMTP